MRVGEPEKACPDKSGLGSFVSAKSFLFFLCLPKENEPKERALFQRHFC